MNDICQNVEHAFEKCTYSILAQTSICILDYSSYKASLSIITIQQRVTGFGKSNFMLIPP